MIVSFSTKYSMTITRNSVVVLTYHAIQGLFLTVAQGTIERVVFLYEIPICDWWFTTALQEVEG